MEKEQKKENKISAPTAIIVAGIIIAGGLYLGLSKNSTNPKVEVNNQAPDIATQQKTVDITKVNIKDNPFIGNPNAKVTIAYWSDYQCPFCKRFEEDAMAQVVKDYVETGKVKVVFKDFSFLGPDSQTAGLAEHAVWEVAPDKFYLWHKAMYDKQDRENADWGNKADIITLTKSLGIDSVKVEQLMNSKSDIYQKIMDSDREEGSSFGINGTPGTIIGKNIVSGAQPYSVVKQLIDSELQIK